MSTKRPISDVADSTPAPDAKKPRLEPCAPGRWRLVVVELCEEADGTGAHIIEGDADGLAPFKALLVECEEYDDEVSAPVTSWALMTMEDEKFDKAYNREYRPYWTRFHELYVKHAVKHEIATYYDVRGVIECNGFFMISGVY